MKELEHDQTISTSIPLSIKLQITILVIKTSKLSKFPQKSNFDALFK